MAGIESALYEKVWTNVVPYEKILSIYCNQFRNSACVMGCTSVDLSSHRRGRNVTLQGRISCWSDPPLQMQAIPSCVSMLQPGWQLLRGFTLQFPQGKVAHVSVEPWLSWSLLKPTSGKQLGKLGRLLWCLLQRLPGPSTGLTPCCCGPLARDTAE